MGQSLKRETQVDVIYTTTKQNSFKASESFKGELRISFSVPPSDQSEQQDYIPFASFPLCFHPFCLGASDHEVSLNFLPVSEISQASPRKTSVAQLQ